MLSFGLLRHFFLIKQCSLKNYSVANDVTPERTDEIMPQEELISDDQNCRDTPLIPTRPSNCSTILLRIIVCLDNRETAHLSLVAYPMANIIDNI